MAEYQLELTENPLFLASIGAIMEHAYSKDSLTIEALTPIKDISPSIANSLSLSTLLRVSVTTSFSQTLSLVSSLITLLPRELSETLAFVDTLSRSAMEWNTRTLPREILTLETSIRFSRETWRVFTQMLTLTEQFGSGWIALLYETITLVETYGNETIGKLCGEVLDCIEEFYLENDSSGVLEIRKSVRREILSLAEKFSREGVWGRTFTSVIEFIDSFSRSVAWTTRILPREILSLVLPQLNFSIVHNTISQTLTLTASVYKSFMKTALTQTLSFVSSLRNMPTKVFTDVVALVESLSTSEMQLKLSDTIEFFDSCFREGVIAVTFDEVVSLVDSIMKRGYKPISASITSSISLTKDISSSIILSVTINDVISKKISPTIVQSISFVEAFVKSFQRELTSTLTFIGATVAEILGWKVLSESIPLYSTVLTQFTFGKILTETLVLTDSVGRSIYGYGRLTIKFIRGIYSVIFTDE